MSFEAQVAVITNVALDHTEFAGPTKVDIAREKAGIIEPTSAVVLGETDPELVDIFRAEGGAWSSSAASDFDVLENQPRRGWPNGRHPYADDGVHRGLHPPPRSPPG